MKNYTTCKRIKVPFTTAADNKIGDIFLAFLGENKSDISYESSASRRFICYFKFYYYKYLISLTTKFKKKRKKKRKRNYPIL